MDQEYNFAYLLKRCSYENCKDLRFCIARLEAGRRALADANPEDGLADWLCFSYLHDVWVGESSDACDNSHDVALLVWEGGVRPDGAPERTWRKLENLKSAMIALGFRGDAPPALSVDIVCMAHRLVMKGLLDAPGDFRTRHAAPVGYATTYTSPRLIARSLARLIESTNDAVRVCSSATDALRIAVVFLERFLFVHPFVNGNGRVARLLMHVLLHRFMPVPFTVAPGSRSEYLDALDDAHRHMNYDRLSQIVLQSAASQSARVEWMTNN